jgi:hypothetical protein
MQRISMLGALQDAKKQDSLYPPRKLSIQGHFLSSIQEKLGENLQEKTLDGLGVLRFMSGELLVELELSRDRWQRL